MTGQEKEISIRQKIEKAKSTIDQIHNLLNFGYYDTAINRIYYACFYAVQALLIYKDITPKSHKGVLNMFSLHYIKEGIIAENFGKHYSRIFDQRMMVDYDDGLLPDSEMANGLLSISVDFIKLEDEFLSEK